MPRFKTMKPLLRASNSICPLVFVIAVCALTWATPAHAKNHVKVSGLNIYKDSSTPITQPGPPITVNVGELISLTAKMGNGSSFDSPPQWSINLSNGTVIKNWQQSDPNNPGASLTTPLATTDETGTTIGYYYTTPATTATVTVSGAVNKKPVKASASFTVVLPATTLTAAQHDVFAGITGGGKKLVSLGNAEHGGTVDGIDFTATNINNVGGTFEWGQILTARKVTLYATDNGTPGSASYHDPDTPGLDTGFPYTAASATTTNDNPEEGSTASIVTGVTVSDFAATMYLMWKSSLASSIPICVQSISWSWSGSAKYSTGVFGKSSGSPPVNYTGNSISGGVLSWSQTTTAGDLVADTP